MFILVEAISIKGKTDFGNSNTKMILNDKRFYQPSTIEYLDAAPSYTDANLDKLIINLMDDLVIHVASQSIKRVGLYSLGSRANLNPQNAKNMNITLGKKFAHDIPLLMDFGMTAAYAIQNYYDANKSLPTELSVTKELTGAIPASEFKGSDPTSKGNSEILADRFTKHDHTVIVYVGNSPVSVKIKYNRVKITQEGVPALYAILEAKPKKIGDRVVNILDKFKALYEEKNPEIAKLTPRELVGKRVLITDIGSGTTEYIHAKNWAPINANCDGKSQGVGHAAARATTLLSSELNGSLTINRQRFDTILLNPNDNLHESAVAHMKNTMFAESESILEAIQERYSVIAGDVDLFIVMGGGSISFEELLYDQVVEFADSVKCMVLWIPEEFAVDLNLDGLDVMHENIFFKEEKPAPRVNKAPSKREV